jgi:hypothetical protein
MKSLHQQLYPTTQELHCEMTLVININQTRNAFLSNWNHSAHKRENYYNSISSNYKYYSNLQF